MTYTTLISDVIKWTQRRDETFSNLVPVFIANAETRIARELKTLGFKKSITSNFTPGASTLAKPARWRATVSFNCGTGPTYSTQARASSGTTHTLYLTEAPSISSGATATVAGSTGTGYNGTFTLTGVSANTITYTSSSITEDVTSETAATVTLARQDRNTMLLRSYEFCRDFWPNPDQTGTPRYYADYDFSNFLIVPTPALALPWELTYYERPVPLDDSNTTNWTTEYAQDLILYATLAETAPYLKDDARVAVWENRYNRILQTQYGQDVVRMNDSAQITGNGGIKG